MIDAIDFQKDECRNDGGALISVIEGMILSNVKKVCCCHSGQIFMQICPAELLARHGDCRIQ